MALGAPRCPGCAIFWRDREDASFVETVVDGITMLELIGLYGVPYYAKIDIEGFDLICLRGFHECQARPSYLSFEVDFDMVDQMIDCAAELGYGRFALVSQKSAAEQKVPRPALEGLDVDYTFVFGSSSLFGKELRTDWVDARKVRSRCNAVVNQHRASGLLRRVGRLLPIDVEKFRPSIFRSRRTGMTFMRLSEHGPNAESLGIIPDATEIMQGRRNC
jgi:hypothetical protein